MNIKIQSPAGYQLPKYEVTLITAPQPFQHSTFQFHGAFGRIHITKMDLQHCTVWLMNYELAEPVSISGLSDTKVYQVFLPVPPSPDDKDQFLAGKAKSDPHLHIFLSFRDQQQVQLPAAKSRMLCIHYTPEYFNQSGNGSYSEFHSFFTETADNAGNPFLLNEAALTILRQIVFASPANKLLHLYLQAKVAELLSILWQLVKPDPSLLALTDKDLDILLEVKKIIMSDLSVLHNSYTLSKQAGTNAYSLRRNFKTWFGIHLHQYLYICRMEKATELLIQTQLTVKKIGFAVGYKNVSNFSEAFKSYYGYPPSAFRDNSGFSKERNAD